MPLQALTSRDAVLRAIAEFDELGREAFLDRYGFHESREFVLRHDGRQYDSKPIVAAAHGFQHPELGPLRSSDFNGGQPTISKLEQLGFKVERLGSNNDAAAPAPVLLRDFLDTYAAARGEPFSGSHPATKLLGEVARSLQSRLPQTLEQARVRSSVGQGNWATVPWIAVLDPRETTTTQQGIYPVLLIPEDLSGVYLTIAQGVTELKRQLGRGRAYKALSERADAIRPMLSDLTMRGFSDHQVVDLGPSPLGRDYAASVIVAKHFSRHELNDGTLVDDFEELTTRYGELLEAGQLTIHTAELRPPAVMSVYVGKAAELNFESGGRRGWWGWRETHKELSDVQVGDLILFGFEYSGGSPRVDAQVWAQNLIRRAGVGRIERVPFRTDEVVMPDEAAGTASYPYKIRFELLDESADVSLGGGTLSRDVAEALRLSALRRGEGIVRPLAGSQWLESLYRGSEAARPVRPIADVAGSFLEAVGESGLRLDPARVETFVAAALTKPFLILTGLSGSGKTQLAMRLGEWCGSDASGNPRAKVIPVRPDWTGPEYLFGYPDALQNRVDGRAVWAVPETLAFLLRARDEPKKPFVLALDEMNLAHVERYFADFLSGVESRQPVLPDLEERDGRWVEADGNRRIQLPDNVTVIGTVNIDETTYLFSPKVLDRAFTFEFRVHDYELAADVHRPGVSQSGAGPVLESFVAYQQDEDWQFEHPHPDREQLVEELREVHRMLGRAGLEFGHRVMYEVLRFAAILEAVNGSGLDEVLDAVVMTKLLPKMHGSRQRLEPVLVDLIGFAQGGGAEEASRARLPMTFSKASRMLQVLREAQFVSFTE